MIPLTLLRSPAPAVVILAGKLYLNNPNNSKNIEKKLKKSLFFQEFKEPFEDLAKTQVGFHHIQIPFWVFKKNDRSTDVLDELGVCDTDDDSLLLFELNLKKKKKFKEF